MVLLVIFRKVKSIHNGSQEQLFGVSIVQDDSAFGMNHFKNVGMMFASMQLDKSALFCGQALFNQVLHASLLTLWHVTILIMVFGFQKVRLVCVNHLHCSKSPTIIVPIHLDQAAVNLFCDNTS
jgi:hypothetical protein